MDCLLGYIDSLMFPRRSEHITFIKCYLPSETDPAAVPPPPFKGNASFFFSFFFWVIQNILRKSFPICPHAMKRHIAYQFQILDCLFRQVKSFPPPPLYCSSIVVLLGIRAQDAIPSSEVFFWWGYTSSL